MFQTTNQIWVVNNLALCISSGLRLTRLSIHVHPEPATVGSSPLQATGDLGRTLFTSRSWNVIKHYNGETSKGGSHKFLGTQKWMVDFMENLIKMDNVGLPPS